MSDYNMDPLLVKGPLYMSMAASECKPDGRGKGVPTRVPEGIPATHYSLHSMLEDSDDEASYGYDDTNTIFDTPPQRWLVARSSPFTQRLAAHKTPTHPVRRNTFDAKDAPPAFSTPIYNRLRADTTNSMAFLAFKETPMNVTRSRNHHTPAKTPSRFNPNVPTTAQANVNYDRRDSMLNGTPSQLSDSPSLSSGSRIPTTEGSSTLPGVPEKFAVQEFAFRQGQQDHGVVSGHIPPSPFAECFDNVWTEHYLRGKAAGGKPRKASDYPPTPSLQGMDTWSVFVNPYTQDLQNPDGSVDMRYMKGICINAVKAMRTCIVTVCRRKGRDEWKKIVCDVPMQVQHALGAFPELQDEYEQLRADASEALGGGLPMGYHGGHR